MVKDMDFLKYNCYKFVTCGIRHLSIWEYKGKNLAHRCINIDKILYHIEEI